MDDITEEYRTSLADLTQNSKPLINMLTMLAEDNETHAAKIVEVIETHLQQVESTKKLPTLYLIDSIIKNLPKSTYPGLFSHNIVGIFCNMFEQVDEKTRQCMFKVRQTWNQHFTGRKMYALDVRVNNIDHAWPLSTPTSNISPIIHVNPKFLQQQREESLPLPDLPPIEDDEAEMRRLLIAKQAELLKLQQKRLELELKETETRLAQQKKTSEDLFVGVEPETASQPGGEATALNTQLTASQTVPRDPRLRDNRDPRMTSRDPRVCRDPRMRNKPVTAELLPNSNEVQPGLTFFGPVTNQPLNQFGQQPSEPALHEHLEPPQITPTMLPQPMNTMVPPQLQAPPPILTEGGNLNTNATPPIKLEMQELKHIHSPKKEMRRNPLIEVKKEISPVKIKVEKEEVDTNIKVKSEKFGSVSPKDKKRSDSRKSASDFRSKESKEHEIIESKASSSRNSRTRTRSSNSDSKSGSESKEGTKSKNKEDHDKGKSQIEEEKDRGKTQNVDNQRGKGKRTPVDHDSRKRNGAGDDRDKGKNWSDSRNRRSKSPRLSHERSRSPVKDSGRGSKNPPRKNKAKNELKNNNKKQMEEQQKLEHRKPISSLPRIPKRTGTDVDERVTEKDHDERRLSSSNKRDLDERHDYKEHEPVRTSKKPRISQERDVPTIEPVTVHTKMNEDISNLFGNEDQDYRHSDAVSPRGGGWARYKADHPKDFDNRRSSLEDIDHRIERQPRDTDYRPAPYYRPPVKSPGYNEGGRSGPQPSDPDVPSELRLENRENILRTMEMRRKSGEISHDDMQTVLRSLSEFDSIQEQRRHQPLRQDPPHLEPEISSQRDDRYRINRPPNEPMMDYHSRRNDPSEPPMEFQSPIKEPRNLPHDADMRRDDRPPVFDDLRREDELPRDTPLDRNRDFDRRNRTRAAERPKEDVHTYKESDRPSHRGTDRPKDDRFLLRGQDRPPHVRGRDFDEPGRPSLLGPGPRIRPEQDTVQNRAPMMNYDIDHRKPPHLERGPPLTDRRPPEIEAVRSPADKPVDERPSLLGPGPANLREKEVPEKKSESLLSKIEPISKLSEKHDAVVKPIAKKIENSALSVGAMLESLRSEHTPENSQDIPDKISKVDVKPKKEETPITKNPPKPAVEGLPTPPDVKILDPVENQKLKDSDIDIKSSDRDRKGRSKRGHSGRSSPSLGQSGSQQTPVSILNRNVPKPPDLKKDMNNDRRRESPLNEERPRSPVRHRDRRRRSPHSPDRRGRRYPILKDDRLRGSPINDQSNFNGPRNIPLFGTGQQSPSPQFNPVGPNQPFPQRSNQPFPPNQQFPGPNQPPFQPGPNQRFSSGPNQISFPVGPNQPFQPGPNQQFPTGPNQQFPQGPNQPMQQFPPGPRPPMQQDEGSQGLHPMFIPGPNQQFPSGPNVHGQPMQLIPPMQNMPVPSQPMPIMSRPPMPVLNQPIPAMSQSMPIPGQCMPGQTIPFIPSVSMMPVYSPELTQALSRYDETGLADLEEKLISSFADSNIWRGGKLQLKFSFNYILLDPRVTKNLPSRMDSLGDEKSFKVFVDGIFYVGKGKGARPYSRLYEAIEQMKKPELQATDKVTRIQDIWSNNVGVVFLHCFQNVISDEAHTREACMIDAIGQKSLTNKNRGSYYGISKTWSEKQRRNMGVYFLKKALQIFKGEGEKQLCRDDILKVGR